MKEGIEDPWIVDVHTHILPPKLALKIRGFFEEQIRQRANKDSQETQVEEVDTCCNIPKVFQDREDWEEKDFESHGQFELLYHPFDPTELIKEQLKNAIHTIWILPYAHKVNIAQSLNASVAKICSSMIKSSEVSKESDVDSETKLEQAIAAFTVHPADGIEIVRQTTIDALTKCHAKVAKLHCSVGNYSILDANLTPFWGLADKVLFPVVVHLGSHLSGNTASTELSDVEELLQQYKNVPFIIAHSGHPAVQTAIKLAMQFDNIYFDTTPVVTKIPAYPSASHPLHADLLKLALEGRILFGTDMPNVAVSLSQQIQAVYRIFASRDWKEPRSAQWWTRKEEATRAGPAVEQILFTAAQKLLAKVDVSKIDRSTSTSTSKM